MSRKSKWSRLNEAITGCGQCPRLRDHCREIASIRRAAYRDEEYWGRPVPNFGRSTAALLIVGLAPGAHGANRTGRMFTGDRSGDFLFRALHETGFANQALCTDRKDRLELVDAVITAAVHCAPPGNKPVAVEFRECFDYLERTVDGMKNLAGVVALGKLAFDASIRLYRKKLWLADRPSPRFGHSVFYEWSGAPFLAASYHPSQQNTFTGRLTHEMLRDFFRQASERIAAAGRGEQAGNNR